MRELDSNSDEYKKEARNFKRVVTQYKEKISNKELGRINANLEEIFSNAEKRSYKKEAGESYCEDRPFERLHYMIGRLFGHLTNKFTKTDLHDEFAKLIKENVNSEKGITVVSFNYDVWLERALQKTKIWVPRKTFPLSYCPSSRPVPKISAATSE
jgi:hypothetical protein